MTFDRKTYYLEKYGPDYFKTIGKKGGEGGKGTWPRRRANLAAGQINARIYQQDPAAFLARFKGKKKKLTTPYRTCPCGVRHEFPDRRPTCITCTCGHKVWYIPNN